MSAPIISGPRRTRSAVAGLLCLVTLVGASAVSAPAEAKGGDVVRRGDCARTTDWKLKVGPEDGRLEVEAQVDSNRARQTWRWRLVHNGSVSASGLRVTRPPSGSFTVRRVMVNLPGRDVVTVRAVNIRSGEVCRGTVRF
ncbi:MAG: hypothetical protein WB441_17545 [Nocardioidaceae bacterium]